MPPSTPAKAFAWKAFIPAALLVGTLDILSAFTYFYLKTGRNPLRVLQYVASGAFGPEAFTGGSVYMLAGLAFHYLIAFCFSALFLFLYPRLSLLRGPALLVAFLYGLFMWAFMNLGVVRLSRIPHQPIHFVPALLNYLILVFAIGLPLALLARRAYRVPKSLIPHH